MNVAPWPVTPTAWDWGSVPAAKAPDCPRSANEALYAIVPADVADDCPLTEICEAANTAPAVVATDCPVSDAVTSLPVVTVPAVTVAL